MINYLCNEEIDRTAWDSCVEKSPGVKPYAFTWYLDIMAPGWKALVDDDYDAVFPVPGFKRYGIQYVATPIFLQRLGVFSPDKPLDESVNEFLGYIPGFYRLIDLCISQKADCDGFHISEKANYELDLSDTYDRLWEAFAPHCRRNIESSAFFKPEIELNDDPGELIQLFLANKGKGIRNIKERDFRKLETLMNYCIRNRLGNILCVRNSSRQLIYGMFVIETKKSKTMLFVVNTPESRKMQTGYYVVNEIIKQYSSSKFILDFAGSSLPSVAFFMSSFGAKNYPYYRLYSNRLVWPLRYLK